MRATIFPHLAHIASDVRSATVTTVLVVAVIGFIALLVIENASVKHERLTYRWARTPVAALLVLALTAIVAPTPGFAQSAARPAGLPDLISDPPYIWFNKNVRLDDGTTIRVMSFDGYIHNIGEGSLELTGNPQLEDGVKQRVFDGETWETVGAPTVKFETDDGHNHFHLVEAIDYTLWDDARTRIVSEASKVGFCLIDTEQVDETFEAFYDIESSNYCGIDSPDATELTMGITPGWRDTYGATITFQWVDTSDIPPGRYWIGAVTDPNNEIVESDEDNNGLVYSLNKWTVDGYVARDLAVDTLDPPITLKAIPYGIVGARAFVIVDGPEHGTLEIPSGVDFLGSEIRYRPGPDYQGSDSFTYYAHDTSSGFPLTPSIGTVQIDAEAPAPPTPATPEPFVDDASEIEIEGSTELALHQSATLASRVAQLDEGSTSSVSWHASELPPGLTVDPSTGAISGVPTVSGDFVSTVYAIADGRMASTPIEFTVSYEDAPELQPLNDFTTTQTRVLATYMGTGKLGSSYEGTGMPLGTSVTSNLPILGGTPEEIGVFDIVINEITDGQVTSSIEFTWTVEPSIRPAFPF